MRRKEFIQRTGALATLLAISPTLVMGRIKNVSSLIQAKIVRNKDGKMVNVLGDHQTFKLTGKDTNGLFTLIESVNDPGMQIPMHVHENEDEVFKVIEGQMEITIGDKKTILKAGDLAFAPRNIPHSWRVVGDTKAKVALSVFPAGLEIMFEELSVLPAGPPDFERVAAIAKGYGISFIPV